MAKTLSHMLPLGTLAADFFCLDVVKNKKITFSQLKSEKATVMMFICNHCPFVKHVIHELVNLANDYIPKGISFIAINSNDVEKYPDDSTERMRELAIELQFPFPYLFDDTQLVAKVYDAACTPDYYIFNGMQKLVYRGQLDGSRPGNNIPVTGKDIRDALDAILVGKEISQDQKPSIGCNIKWK